jgi:hypothetical protein
VNFNEGLFCRIFCFKSVVLLATLIIFWKRHKNLHQVLSYTFSALKLVHLFSINPHLGPLQISLGRMVIDSVKFFFIYSLVLFAFACGKVVSLILLKLTS